MLRKMKFLLILSVMVLVSGSVVYAEVDQSLNYDQSLEIDMGSSQNNGGTEEPAMNTDDLQPVKTEGTPENTAPAPKEVKKEPAKAPEAVKVVPEDTKPLDDSFAVLEKKMTPEELEAFKKASPSQLTEYYSSLGPWISDVMIKPSGSPLRSYFNEHGVFGPMDISKLVIKAFHRHLNKKSITFDELNNDSKSEAPQDNKKKK